MKIKDSNRKSTDKFWRTERYSVTIPTESIMYIGQALTSTEISRSTGMKCGYCEHLGKSKGEGLHTFGYAVNVANKIHQVKTTSKSRPRCK